MAQPYNLVAYGFTNPLQNVFSAPLQAKRAPLTTDIGFQCGQVWIDMPNNQAYILTSVANSSANWLQMGSSLTIPVSIADGGTNATSFANTYGIVYYDGTRLVDTTVGNAGEVLTSNGIGVAPTFQAAGGGGIVTINGDSGSVTGATVAFNGLPQAGSSVTFTGSATTMLLNITDASNNTLIGRSSGNSTLTGTGNAAVGFDTLNAITNGSSNSAFGSFALRLLQSGLNNVALGNGALSNSTADSGNIAIGSSAGSNLDGSSNNIAIGGGSLSGGLTSGTGKNISIGLNSTSLLINGTNNIAIGGNNAGANWNAGESNNICIGAQGVVSENNALHIGDSTASSPLTSAFIGGIVGVTTALNDAVPVLIASDGQLGTTSSSLKYKEDVADMGSYSDVLSKLRPVTFHYKKHAIGEMSVGLIAEEVALVAPALVVYKDGEPETVRYNDLVPMLLNEIQKLNKKIDALEPK